MKTTPLSDERQPLLVSEPEAARLLGVTGRTVFSLRQRGELPAVKIGTRILYPLAAIESFISKNMTTATA